MEIFVVHRCALGRVLHFALPSAKVLIYFSEHFFDISDVTAFADTPALAWVCAICRALDFAHITMHARIGSRQNSLAAECEIVME
jgi:hypothetical protein